MITSAAAGRTARQAESLNGNFQGHLLPDTVSVKYRLRCDTKPVGTVTWLWPLGVQRPAPRHMRKSTSPRNDTLDGPGRPRRMTPRLLRGPTGSVGARHGPWATTRRARPQNGGATAARRAGGACIAPRATPIPTGRTARGKKCAPCPCPRRPGCLAGLRVSRPGSAPFASTPPPPLCATVQRFALLLIDGMDVVLRKYGLCTSSIAPATECQSWEKCDLTKHISRQNKENIENFIQHF